MNYQTQNYLPNTLVKGQTMDLPRSSFGNSIHRQDNEESLVEIKESPFQKNYLTSTGRSKTDQHYQINEEKYSIHEDYSYSYNVDSFKEESSPPRKSIFNYQKSASKDFHPTRQSTMENIVWLPSDFSDKWFHKFINLLMIFNNLFKNFLRIYLFEFFTVIVIACSIFIRNLSGFCIIIILMVSSLIF
jgi:hypothetical protein